MRLFSTLIYPSTADTILPPESDLAPPQGPPILDEQDKTNLDQWFDSPDHNASLVQNTEAAAFMTSPDFNFPFENSVFHSWPYPDPNPFATTQPPSTFVNNNNNHGQPPSVAHQHSLDSVNPPVLQHAASRTSIPRTGPPDLPSDIVDQFNIGHDTPPDILDAATKLFNYRSQKQPYAAAPMHSDQSHLSMQPPRHDRQSSASETYFHTPSRSSPFSSMQYPHPNGNYTQPFGSATPYTPTSHPSMPHQSPYAPPSQPQYGSDVNFGNNGYSGSYHPSDQQHLQFALNMAPQYPASQIPSANSSVPQSPVLARQDHQFDHPHAFPHPPMKRESYDANAYNPTMRKRRRTIATSVDTDHEAQYSTYVTSEQHSPPNNSNWSPEDNAPSPFDNRQSTSDEGEDHPPVSSRKRRKSSSAAQKSASTSRKNLSDAQKRANHIKSEQKRRTIISDGYKALTELVPNLKQGGFSKSATLTETVRELETLQQGNKGHREALAQRAGLTLDDLQIMMDSLASSVL